MRSAAFPLAPYVERFPEKAECHRVYREALRVGQITRGRCEVEGCRSAQTPHGHHVDYAKPLDVMWLCQQHHIAWHREFGQGLNGGDPAELGGDGLGALTLVGVIFGRLTVARETRLRGLRAWVCNCACGGQCVRTTQALYNSAGAGSLSMCDACKLEARDKKFAKRRERLAESFNSGGSLYGIGWAAHVESELLEEFEREIAPRALETVASLGVMRSGGLESLWDDPCDNPETMSDGMTLQEIGADQGVTRERIRQLEGRALSKLATAAKAHLKTDGVPLPTRVRPVAATPIHITRKPRPKAETPKRVDPIAARIAQLEAEIASLRAQQGAA